MSRVDKDVEEAIKLFENDETVSIKILDEKTKWLRVIISGIEGTPYDQGKFQFEIIFPNNYPFKPPFVSCHTKIWHPNVSLSLPPSKQNLCLAMICFELIGKEDQANPYLWTPKKTLIELIEALKGLIHCQEPYFSPKCPLDIDKMGLNSEAGEQYQKSNEKFLLKAKEWTKKYAIQ